MHVEVVGHFYPQIRCEAKRTNAIATWGGMRVLIKGLLTHGGF